MKADIARLNLDTVILKVGIGEIETGGADELAISDCYRRFLGRRYYGRDWEEDSKT